MDQLAAGENFHDQGQCDPGALRAPSERQATLKQPRTPCPLRFRDKDRAMNIRTSMLR